MIFRHQHSKLEEESRIVNTSNIEDEEEEEKNEKRRRNLFVMSTF